MLHQIYHIDAGVWNSILITPDEFWISGNKVKSFEKFEKQVQKTGLMKMAKAYPLSSVTEVSFNEADGMVKLIYINEKEKKKKLQLDFKEVNRSNEFGHFLGQHIGLYKQVKKENFRSFLLWRLLPLVLTILFTGYFASIEDTDAWSGTGSSRRKGTQILIKTIIDTIGTTGVLLLGGAIAAIQVYLIYKRYQNPAMEVCYGGVKK